MRHTSFQKRESEMAPGGSVSRPLQSQEGIKAMSPDDIIRQIGGCGRFQIILSVTIHLMKTVISWSLVGPVFILYTPKWRCGPGFDNETIGLLEATNTSVSISSNLTNASTSTYWGKQCASGNEGTCSRYIFESSPRTLVSQFDLVCHQAWVPSTIMSMQMAGLCAGNLLAGQSADIFGRKRPLFLSMLMLFTLHLVSVFSVNWVMFAVLRVFVGLGCGFFLSIQYNLMSEYTLSRWRAVIIGFPSFPVEASFLVLCAWLTQDWKQVTLATSVLAFLFLGAWFIVPESFRWYVGHDRYADAEGLIRRVAKFNNCPTSVNIELDKSMSRSNDDTDARTYTIIDLFKSRKLLKFIMCLMVCWFTVGFGSYGISFGIQRLSGNIYLNLFLFNISSIPSKLITICLQNRFGRKTATLTALTVCGVGGLGAGVMQYIHIDDEVRGTYTNYFALAANVGVWALWGPLQTITVELFPTVIRSVSFGFLSTLARIGAIIGPQLSYFSDLVPGLLYFAVALVCTLSIISILCLPETRDAYLMDKLPDKSYKGDDKSVVVSRAVQ